jgi:PIN domain nuclease of toxin-antitoxin system
MDLLLDAHTFIWFFNGDKKLPLKVRKLIEDFKNKKFISIASVWEVSIKISLKKLEFDGGMSEITELIEKNDFNILPVSIEHLIAYESLEIIHRDPFDRILVAQAMVEKMVIITKDENIKKYKIKTEW